MMPLLPHAFTRYLAARLPSCREVTRWGSDSLDRPLPLARRIGLRFHLLICTWCRRYLRQIAFLRQAVRTRPDRLADESEGPTAAGLSPDARERIARAMRERAH